jgi:hypothetical protein
MALISRVLSDRDRPGTTNYFSTQQVVQIVALACESPLSPTLERGFEFSPFPTREAGALVRSWGVRFRVGFST